MGLGLGLGSARVEVAVGVRSHLQTPPGHRAHPWSDSQAHQAHLPHPGTEHIDRVGTGLGQGWDWVGTGLGLGTGGLLGSLGIRGLDTDVCPRSIPSKSKLQLISLLHGDDLGLDLGCERVGFRYLTIRRVETGGKAEDKGGTTSGIGLGWNGEVVKVRDKPLLGDDLVHTQADRLFLPRTHQFGATVSSSEGHCTGVEAPHLKPSEGDLEPRSPIRVPEQGVSHPQSQVVG